MAFYSHKEEKENKDSGRVPEPMIMKSPSLAASIGYTTPQQTKST